MKRLHSFAVAVLLAGVGPIGSAFAHDPHDGEAADCRNVPSASAIRNALIAAGGDDVGGLFGGRRMWAAVVNRSGQLCSIVASTQDPTQAWPGSQAIAKSKAYTANAFSLDNLALSTARLYTFSQPGHSLWSLGQSNLFNTEFLNKPQKPWNGMGEIPGGLIFFGGGVPLYKDKKIVGGLGVSGDTSCADHEIAKRVRNTVDFNPPGGQLVDDITYTNPDGAGPFTHPACLNTWRNGRDLKQDEKPATGY